MSIVRCERTEQYLPGKIASHRYADVAGSRSITAGIGRIKVRLRLAAGWKANHDNCDPPRVEQPPRHGAVQLGRGQVALVFGDIMYPIDEGRTLAAIPRRVDRDLGSAAAVSNGGAVGVYSTAWEAAWQL